MGQTNTRSQGLNKIIEAILNGTCTEAQSLQLARLGPEAVQLAVLADWYEQIGQQARDNGHLHADETGWRVNGQTHWLWCFANGRLCYYMIDKRRGQSGVASRVRPIESR